MRHRAWLGMTRLYARILGGGRIYDTAPKKHLGKVSLLAAVTSQGFKADACLMLEDSVDTATFLTYLRAGFTSHLRTWANRGYGQLHHSPQYPCQNPD